MMVSSSSPLLEDYIARTYLELGIDKPKDFFSVCFGQHAPTLTPHTVNRILVYPGKFNPPHYGHLATLHDGFHNTGADLNLIVAMIVPRGDGYTDHLQLTKSERANLWRGADDYLSDYYWVFEGCYGHWIEFEKTLVEIFASTVLPWNGCI